MMDFIKIGSGDPVLGWLSAIVELGPCVPKTCSFLKAVQKVMCKRRRKSILLPNSRLDLLFKVELINNSFRLHFCEVTDAAPFAHVVSFFSEFYQAIWFSVV